MPKKAKETDKARKARVAKVMDVKNKEYSCPKCGKKSVVKDNCQRCLAVGK